MIHIVSNHKKYWESISRLRSDPRIQHCFLEPLLFPIEPNTQKTHMEKYGDNYIVALDNDEVVGYARSFDRDIAVCVDPEHQRKGIGEKLIKEIVRRYPDSYARVKTTNIPSMTLFKKCNFVVTKTVTYDKTGENLWIMNYETQSL